MVAEGEDWKTVELPSSAEATTSTEEAPALSGGGSGM